MHYLGEGKREKDEIVHGSPCKLRSILFLLQNTALLKAKYFIEPIYGFERLIINLSIGKGMLLYKGRFR